MRRFFALLHFPLLYHSNGFKRIRTGSGCIVSWLLRPHAVSPLTLYGPNACNNGLMLLWNCMECIWDCPLCECVKESNLQLFQYLHKFTQNDYIGANVLSVNVCARSVDPAVWLGSLAPFLLCVLSAKLLSRYTYEGKHKRTFAEKRNNVREEYPLWAARDLYAFLPTFHCCFIVFVVHRGLICFGGDVV